MVKWSRIYCHECGHIFFVDRSTRSNVMCQSCGVVYMCNFRGKFVPTGEKVDLGSLARVTHERPKKDDVGASTPEKPPPQRERKPERKPKPKRKCEPRPRRKKRKLGGQGREDRPVQDKKETGKLRGKSVDDVEAGLNKKFGKLEGLVSGDYGKSHFE